MTTCNRNVRLLQVLNFVRPGCSKLHMNATVFGGVRADGWWIRDHKPGRVPKNDEERRLAAIKYGLRPEDYKQYPDDEEATGDYPDLGLTTYAHKDPYENWSIDKYRRNWGEPVYWHWDTYRADRKTFTGLETDSDIKLHLLIPKVIATLGGLSLAIWFLTRDFHVKLAQPLMPKQYAYDFYRAYPWDDPRNYPITNYTFDPLDDEAALE